MGKLLRNAPIEILEIRSRNRVRRFHLRRLQRRLQLDVEGEIVFCPQIWQRLGILFGERFPKWLERFHGHDPRRNARAKIFRQKRTERLVFPSLNVARAPIVH